MLYMLYPSDVRPAAKVAEKLKTFGSTAARLFLLRVEGASGKSFTSASAIRFGGLGVPIVRR